MQITDTAGLPSVIASSTTLESAILLLSDYVLGLQTSLNSSLPETEVLSFIDVIANISGAEPYVSIDFNITANIIESVGVLHAINPLTNDTFSQGTGNYPWNLASSVNCLMHLFLYTFNFEKKAANNPDELETMTLSINQNTTINEAQFEVSASLDLPISVSQTGEDITYTAVEYLTGSI